ncbi:hypothetical protein SAMN05216275_12491 [Streptosporangium canum]|uniref:DUF3558 domain-containing protein n=1 Tax=Streptosporangium canum TaxID=324952 RepID=A0A1I3ZAN5_9ACTN|nr:hypothetical protein [Streptosporangium canum]SFK40980.1 hypothetical protein SAMN05216275_12491 [Streptosporangium canum]
MRFRCQLVALIAVMLLGTACTPEDSALPTPAPVATDAIVDSPPYVCKFVPDQAFRLVSGVKGSLSEQTNGNETNGDCGTPGAIPKSLSVAWMQEAPQSTREYLGEVMDDRRKVFTRHGAATLPADLGEGLAVHLAYAGVDEQPYQVVARFNCGGKQRIITLYLAQIAKGRDGIRDTIELMRIAQKRYGQLYACTPGK